MQERRRTRERDADVAREAIMNAAERVFAEKGFGGARVDAIAEEAGYNKALIFHYFGDKEGLYQALIERMMEINSTELSRIFAPFANDETAVTDPAQVGDAIAATVRWTFDFYREHPHLLRMLAWEAASNWSTFTFCAKRRAAGSPLPTWKLQQRAWIRRAQEAGIIRADLDPVMLVVTIIGVTMNHLLSLRRYEGIFPDVDFSTPDALLLAREQIVGLVLHGTMANTQATTASTETQSTAREPLGHEAVAHGA
jgi:TetR/AcrR family transcriptional regulator